MVAEMKKYSGFNLNQGKATATAVVLFQFCDCIFQAATAAAKSCLNAHSRVAVSSGKLM